MGIKSIRIQNFKSIKDSQEIDIKPLNILIGSNGVGKSNFISFFKFLNKLYQQQLQLYITQYGRADNFLYFGRKTSDFLYGSITFNNEWKNEYTFKMVPDQSGSLIFAEEYSNYTYPDTKKKNISTIVREDRFESFLKQSSGFRNKYLRQQFENFKVYHFHDTGFNSKMKQSSSTLDNVILHEDGSNIAAFLYKLQQGYKSHFLMIKKIVQSIAPFFDSFYLQPDEIDKNVIFLRWKEKGSDQLFTAHNFSDGTLRMIALTTVLLQPNMPSTIIIDEPELGLHPFAISKLASMIKNTSTNTQLIISTQSVNFVNQFSADDILVVDRANNQTLFKRQSDAHLKTWLEDYCIGELWEKNIIGGMI